MTNKIVFLQASINNSHFIKRVVSLKEGGFDVKVYGFKRNIESNNFFPKDIPVKTIGHLTNGKNYASRLLILRKALAKVFRENPDAIFYATTFDIGFFCWLYNKTYIYEISDFVYVNFPTASHVAFKLIDKRMIEKSAATIMTSEGFHQFLYRKEGNSPHILFLPNKLNNKISEVKRSMIKLNENNTINFSFIGQYRYPNTILRFARIIGEYFPEHSFHFWGNGILKDKIQQLTCKYTNIFEHGPFKNPDDLSDIYTQTDVVVACYDTSTINERIAEPNKLYEALYFNRPIIVSEDTFLAEKVKKQKCGFIINPFDDTQIIQFVRSLDKNKLHKISEHISTINAKDLIDDPTQLINLIRQI